MGDENYKAMTALSVEIVLMRKGGPQYHLVVARLERDHDCKIFDCFDHPDYLRSVLKEVYGDDYRDIVDNIEAEFGEMIDRYEIAAFVNKLRQ